ncbi:unnamed protein product [Peniophora sp. CBMAI 1063]|nr:unnamed protein product [Peniophora sp. CBMAI 1063]
MQAPLRAARAARRVPQLARAASTSSAAASGASGLRTTVTVATLAVVGVAGTVYYLDSRAAIHRYIVTPSIRILLDPETSHKVAVKALASGLGPRDFGVDEPQLVTELWGKEYSNPLGIAAGFDKEGEAVDGLFNLGFAWVEIGSVTPKPQPGNPKPRVFHLPESDALINRYGFPSSGHASVLQRLRARLSPFPTAEQAATASQRPGVLLAVNLGKNKTSAADSAEDYVAGVRAFAPFADVLVVNVSSPNTPGLRALQRRDALAGLLREVVDARDEAALDTPRRPKLVLKIAPDLSEQELADIGAAVVATPGVDGVIVSNTTIQRPSTLIGDAKSEAGGLSGPPVKPLSLAALSTLRSHLPATIPLIGCGGISSGEDALEFARAGASAVQLYTSMGYGGPGTPRRIKDELAAALAAEGTTWRALVDKAVTTQALKPKAAPKSKPTQPSSLQQLISEAEAALRKLGEATDGESARTDVVADTTLPATAAVLNL